MEQIQGILYRPFRLVFFPKGKVSYVHVMFNLICTVRDSMKCDNTCESRLTIELVDEAMINPILSAFQDLACKREFDRGSVDVKLDNYEVILVEFLQNRVQWIELAALLFAHAYEMQIADMQA